MEENTLKDIVIIYHGRCRDGYGAAYAAWRKFGDNATYLPYLYTDPKPVGLENKEVYVIDFCFDSETTKHLEGVASIFVVIDHHSGAEEVVKSVERHVFDLSKSGAYLAWEYFHPNTNVPKLIQYISDSDTWAHVMPNWKEVESYIYKDEIEMFTFNDFEKLHNEIETEEGYKRALEVGGILCNIRDQDVKKYSDRAELISFEGYTVYAVSAPSELRSELGHELASRTNLFAVVFNYEKGNWKCSLRSVKDFDVSVIAKKYGGGGHKNAAAFFYPTDFPLPFAKAVKKEDKE